MTNFNFRCLLVSAIVSLVPFASLSAQRATQVVRYSVTGVSQGKFGGTTAGKPGPTTPGGVTGGFGSVTPPPDKDVSTASTANAATRVTATAARQEPGVRKTTSSLWQASYEISNNEANKKLSISIDAPMPDGMELTADIGAPSGAEATGPVDMATSSLDVVTGIGAGATGALPIEFSLTATEGKSREAGSRKVSFTFISGA